MAYASVFPGYARILADASVAFDPDVERTNFDDGSIRQARKTTRPLSRRDVTALIPHARVREFRNWASDYAHQNFLWRDPDDDLDREARVRGGQGAIQLKSTVRGGERFWQATFVVEGYRDKYIVRIRRVQFAAAAPAMTIAIEWKYTAAVLFEASIPTMTAGARQLQYSLAAALASATPVLSAQPEVSYFFALADFERSDGFYLNHNSIAANVPQAVAWGALDGTGDDVPINWAVRTTAHGGNSFSSPPPALPDGEAWLQAGDDTDDDSKGTRFLRSATAYPASHGHGWRLRYRLYADLDTGEYALDYWLRIAGDNDQYRLSDGVHRLDNPSENFYKFADIRPWQDKELIVDDQDTPPARLWIGLRGKTPGGGNFLGIAGPPGKPGIEITALTAAPVAGGAGGSVANAIRVNSEGFLVDGAGDFITDDGGDRVYLPAA